MVCDAWDKSLDRYLDGELPDADLPALEAHLVSCASCACEALSRRELRGAIREAGARYSPSPHLRRRVERSLTQGARPALAAWVAPLAAALLVAAGLLVWLGPWGSKQDLVLGEVLDLHVTALASTTPVDVVSSDAHTVKPWFEGRLPFTFDLPDLGGMPFVLLGGRVAWVDHEPAAHLIFQVRRHRVSAFIFRDGAAGLDVGTRHRRKLSYRFLSWSSEGLRYTLVADTGVEDLEALAGRFRRAAGP